MPETDNAIAPPDQQFRAAERGSRPALIERFGIKGLYGYRTISLTSEFAATVLIAKNGIGKTTLLGALDAFLKMQLFRLRELEFEEIFCRVKGESRELVLTHDMLVEFLQVPKDGDFARLVTRTGIDGNKLFNFITGDQKASFDQYYYDYDSNSTVNQLARAFPDIFAARKSCEEAYNSLFQRTPALSALRLGIDRALSNYEIVYLPTYRRVELSLTDDGESKRRRGKSRPRVNIAASGLHTADIQFGLGDISERLNELNNDIIVSSNFGYREISENIINELIDGLHVADNTEIPKPEELKLFFSRLESGKRMIGPYYSVSQPNLDKIYSGVGVPEESRKFLTYFLGKLNDIINLTKEIEEPIGAFVDSCNKYLSSLEPSTSAPYEASHRHLRMVDAKALRINRTNLNVHVESIPARTPISLDALSSGEKQMVSLFAKMYLYPKKKVVLIDEPELSLSIDWQRGILIDVLMSPHCEQVIAITHSPFVFDNSLEPFARTLDLEVAERFDPELRFESIDSGHQDVPTRAG